jgi:hypothetical protein
MISAIFMVDEPKQIPIEETLITLPGGLLTNNYDNHQQIKIIMQNAEIKTFNLNHFRILRYL